MAVVVAALVWSARADAASSRAPCPPAGAHVVAHDRVATVYTFTEGSARGVGTAACLRKGGARMTLIPGPRHRPSLPRQGEVQGILMAGPIVAFTEHSFGIDSGSSDVEVVDVARRRVLRSIHGTEESVDAGIGFYRHVVKMVLSAKGSVAWISEEGGGFVNGHPLKVHAAPIGAPEELLDEGPGIGAETLAISGTTVTWWDSGVLRSAPLP